MSSDLFLIHFDSDKLLLLSVDAYPKGLGAALSHKMSNGSEKLIAFDSRTLSKSEWNYAQIEKDGLASIFGVKKISFVPLWQEIYSDYRPTTPQQNFRSNEKHFSLSRS